MLKLLILINIVGILILLFVPGRQIWLVRALTLCFSCLLFFISIMMWVIFENNTLQFQFLIVVPWCSPYNMSILIGVDGLSLFFMLITTLIFPFCIVASFNLAQSKFLLINLLLIELCLILTFSVLDLFLFCLFFESLLVPMFFLILGWGTRERKIKALGYFFIYTLIGSIFIMLAIFLLYFETQSTSFYAVISNTLSKPKQITIWLLLVGVFAIKIPMFPFHIWLPEAHVEAPTLGSVILAALLLKIGSYGMLRFLFIFDYARYFFQPWIIMFCILSIIYSSIMAIRQLDLKRIIAYSSIAHMNFALLGYFSNTVYGLTGGLLLMVSHAVVSAAIFFIVGVAYERHHTRLIYYYGGLVQLMPLYAIFCFLFIISNFSFPGTSNFVGELLVLISLGLSAQKFILLVAGLSTFFTLVYSIFLFNRVLFGNIKIQFIELYTDIARNDFYILTYLMFINILMGLMPNSVINAVYLAISNLTRYQASYIILSMQAPQDNGEVNAGCTDCQVLGKTDLGTPSFLQRHYVNFLQYNTKLSPHMDFTTWKEYTQWLFDNHWLEYHKWINLIENYQYNHWLEYEKWLETHPHLREDMSFDVWLDFSYWKTGSQLLHYMQETCQCEDVPFSLWREYLDWVSNDANTFIKFSLWQEYVEWRNNNNWQHFNAWRRDNGLQHSFMSTPVERINYMDWVSYIKWLELHPHLAEDMTFEVWQEFMQWLPYLQWAELHPHLVEDMTFEVWQEFMQWLPYLEWAELHPHLVEDMTFEVWQEFVEWLPYLEWAEAHPHLAEDMTFEVWQEFMQWLPYLHWMELHPHLAEDMTFEVWQEFMQWLPYLEWAELHPHLVEDMTFEVWQEFVEWLPYLEWAESHPHLVEDMTFEVWQEFMQWLPYLEWVELHPHLAEDMTFEVWQEFMQWLPYLQWAELHPHLVENMTFEVWQECTQWLPYLDLRWVESHPHLAEDMTFEVWQEFMQWLPYLEWAESHPHLVEDMTFEVWQEFVEWLSYLDWLELHPHLAEDMTFEVWQEFVEWLFLDNWVDYENWLDEGLNVKIKEHMTFEVWLEFAAWKSVNSRADFNEWIKDHSLNIFSNPNFYMDLDIWQLYVQWKNKVGFSGDNNFAIKVHPILSTKDDSILNTTEQFAIYIEWVGLHPHLAADMTFEVWQEFMQWLPYLEWAELHPHLVEDMTFEVWQEFVEWLPYLEWAEAHPHLAEDMTFEVWQEFMQWLPYLHWMELHPHLAEDMTFEVWQEFGEWLYFCDFIRYEMVVNPDPNFLLTLEF